MVMESAPNEWTFWFNLKLFSQHSCSHLDFKVAHDSNISRLESIEICVVWVNVLMLTFLSRCNNSQIGNLTCGQTNWHQVSVITSAENLLITHGFT